MTRTALAALFFLAACAGQDTRTATGAEPPEAQRQPAPERQAPEPEDEAGPADFALTTERSCLAMTAYHEARGEGTEAMEAVAHAVMNRARSESFPGDACAVVREGGETPPCQFSWWCDGRPDVPENEELWAEASRIADRVLNGESADPTGGAVYFYAGAKPAWTAPFRETAAIGSHVFLAE